MKGMRTPLRIVGITVVLAAVVWSLGAAQSLSVPVGFEIEVFAEGLNGVRALETTTVTSSSLCTGRGIGRSGAATSSCVCESRKGVLPPTRTSPPVG